MPGVNNHDQYGRRAFAEFTDVYEMQTDFEEKGEEEFNKMIDNQLTENNTKSESIEKA